MSFLDDLPTPASVAIHVCLDCLHLDFTRIPDADVINDICTAFKKRPGFYFGQGIAVAGQIMEVPLLEPNPLKYAATFPPAHKPIDVARALVAFFATHGLTAEIHDFDVDSRKTIIVKSETKQVEMDS